jgi:hypothetical protein
MLITAYRSLTDTRAVRTKVPWQDLPQWLSERTQESECLPGRCPPNCAAKFQASGWSPSLYDKGAKRNNASVKAVSALVYDLDELTLDAWRALKERLRQTRWLWFAHSTHRHSPTWSELHPGKLRLILLLARPAQPHEWKTLFAQVLQRLELTKGPEQAKDLSRFFFCPVTAKGQKLYQRHGGSIPVPVNAPSAPALPSNSRSPSYVASTLPPPPPRLADKVARRLKRDYNESVNLKQLRRLVARQGKLSSKKLARRILKGLPLGQPGERDDTMQRAAGLLAYSCPPGTPLEALLEILRPSLMATESDDPDMEIAKAEDKLARAIMRREEVLAKEEEERLALVHELAEISEDADEPNTERYWEDEETPKEIRTPKKKKGEPYTQEQLAKWAAEAECSVKKFEKRWIIQNDRANFVFVGGKYRAPVPTSSLELSLQKDFARAPIPLWTETEKGALRRVPLRDILLKHGTVARHLRCSLVRKHSHFDSKTETFIEALCPPRKLVPTEFPEVNFWLHTLGGNKLLDWVATSTQLDKQTCALYIMGPKGVGKSLLADGLARIWSIDGATPLHSIFEDFNDYLSKCPLVFADEQLPSRRDITADLRALIGSGGQFLKRKFLPATRVEGALRLIIAANNANLLTTKNDLSEYDLAAVAERFCYIAAPQAAADFLQQIGGKDEVAKWLAEDRIARHTLWLAKKRKVKEGGRWLVSGELSSWHESLAVQSGIGSAVCEWLVKYLMKYEPSRGTRDVLIGEGEYWVNAQAMSHEMKWTSNVHSERVPPLKRINDALKIISMSGARPRPIISSQRVWMHRIRVPTLLHYAREANLGDVEQLKKKIKAKNPMVTRYLPKRKTKDLT